jgi:hypothetical protein
MLAVFVLVAAAGRGAYAIGRGFVQVGFLVFAVCAMTAAAEVLARATSLWARLIVFGLGVGTIVPLLLALTGGRMPNGSALALAALTFSAVTVTPHAVVLLASRVPALGGSTARRTAVLVAAATLFGLCWLDPRPNSEAIIIALILPWFLAVQTAFHASAASAASLGLVALEMGLAGVVCEAALQVTNAGRSAHDHVALGFAAGWLAGCLLLPIARLGRSLTAVPLDHPIYTDFGGPSA